MLNEPENGNYSNPIRIRAHHLLCIQGYQGHGYNKEFEKNMDKIVKQLESFPEQELEIIAECDDICFRCPHNVDELCRADTNPHMRVNDMDMFVLEKLDLKEETIDSAQNLFNLVNEKLDNFDVQQICGSCSWKLKCLWFKEKDVEILNKNLKMHNP